MSGNSSAPTNFLELRVYGLQRSGNHAVIEWILDQHRGKRTCFLNNVRHGNHDPYNTAEQSSLSGFGSMSDLEAVRWMYKHVLIYSYEDDVSKMQSGRNFVESAHDEEFERNRHLYVGTSEHRVDILVLRDPFNFFASRLRRRGSLTAIRDSEATSQNWKLLARQAIHAGHNPASGKLVISYNRWFADKRYRRELSKTLHGRFSDASLESVAPMGGGSSFDSRSFSRLSLRTIRRKWKKLFESRVYLRADIYWKRLFARGAHNMKVLERWQALRDDDSYRRIFADREVLDLSERIFDELPGTREFVARCAEVHGADGQAAGSLFKTK